jgi:signal transduction histidine kinase
VDRIFFSLRAKTIIIVTLTLLALLGVQWLLLSTIAQQGFSALERQQMDADVGRVRAAIDADLRQLSTQVSDYALWDDSYAFVQNHNAAYIENNLYDQVFVGLEINLAVFLDAAGDVVFIKAVDLASGVEVPEPAALMATIRSADVQLVRLPIDHDVYGLLALPDGLMLIAARPITTSLGEGPPAGTLIYGRYLDARKQQQLATLTHLSFSLQRVDDPRYQPSLASERAALNQLGSVQVDLPDDGRIVGYTLLSDISNQPLALLRVETPRSVSQQGRWIIAAVGVSLAVAGVVFIAVVLCALEFGGLRRLARLSRSVAAVGTRSDPGQRVVAEGRDELGRLGASINAMLAALEQAQAERLLALEEQGRIEQERAAIKAKRDLLGMVSHEMRTPLTPIRGYTDILLLPDADPLTPDQREYVQSIRTSALYLGLLIEDLLEFGRLEANSVTLALRSVALPDLVANVVELLRPAIDRKCIALSVELPPSLPVIEGDHKRLTQVLVNLLSNAVKYTYSEGSVSLRAVASDDCVVLEVADTGVGLSPEQMERLFTRFYRADNPLSHEAGGSGLGLAIAHAFVTLHGGTITVQSQQGVGSVFRVALPLRQSSPDKHQPSAQSTPQMAAVK